MKRLSLWQAVAIALEMGAALAVAVLIGLVGGHAIDERMGIDLPVFTMLGALVGLAAGVYASTRLIQFFTSAEKE